MSLTAVAWRGRTAFAAQASDWEHCARAAGLDPLCNSHAWSLAHARAFTPEDEVFGWRFEHAGETVALIALRMEPARGPLRLRRALFLADGTFDSDYLEPPIVPGHERAVAHALIDAARATGACEALVLAGMPDESRFLAALRAELTSRGLTARSLSVPCLSAPLGETLEASLTRLKPRMRSKVRSSVRAAQERGARLEWCTRQTELPEWLDQLFELHELRWNRAQASGSFADPRRRAFYHELCGQALARGALRFARLREAGRTLATQIGLREGARYYQLQEGFDPALEEQRVGIALRGLALEALIAEGVRAYDFMAGDSRHKRDWGGEPRPCSTLTFPLPRWRARLAFALRARLERWRGH